MKELKQLLMNLSRTQAFMVSAVVAGVYYFVMYDSGERLEQAITAAQSSVQAAELEKNQLQTKINAAKDFQAKFVEYGDQLKTLVELIPTDMKGSRLMDLLSSEARAAGTNLMSIAVNSTSRVKEDFFEKISVNLKLQGTYSQLMVFFAALTKLDVIITMAELSFQTTASVEGNAPILSFDGIFSSYRYIAEPTEEKK